MADETDSIKAKILTFPDKKYYAGFFEEFLRQKAQSAEQAKFRAPSKPQGFLSSESMDILREIAMDASHKVMLIEQHRRKSAAND